MIQSGKQISKHLIALSLSILFFAPFINARPSDVAPADTAEYEKFHPMKKWAYGGNIIVNFDNEWTKFTNPEMPETAKGVFQIELKPKFYWFINEKLTVGGRAGFSYGHLVMGKKETEKPSVGKAIGWSVGPFCSYRLIKWKRLSAWLEANVSVGQYYNTSRFVDPSKEWSMMTEYGFQILPVGEIYLAEGYSLQLHIGFISFGWYGTTQRYDDRTVRTSYWDLRKGGFDALLASFANYGIGLVKRF